MDFRLESMMRLAAVDSILPWLSDALGLAPVLLLFCARVFLSLLLSGIVFYSRFGAECRRHVGPCPVQVGRVLPSGHAFPDPRAAPCLLPWYAQRHRACGTRA